MRFLCDEMLAGLARWLRAAGYDARLAAPGLADRRLLAQARRERRLLITRDKKLMEHRGAPRRVVLLKGTGLEACALELAAKLPLDWLHRPFTRCLICNTPLARAGAAARRRLPPGPRRRRAAVAYCPDCRRLYWDGGHVERMRRRLKVWASRSAASTPRALRSHHSLRRSRQDPPRSRHMP